MTGRDGLLQRLDFITASHNGEVPEGLRQLRYAVEFGLVAEADALTAIDSFESGRQGDHRPFWHDGGLSGMQIAIVQHGGIAALDGSAEGDAEGADGGAALLDRVRDFLDRFVAYPSSHALVAHALWIVHTHAMDAWESTPRIAFLSPEPASGKTRALEVSFLPTPRPVEAMNTTPAYLLRKVSDPDGLPTVLFDEIDAIFGPKAKEHEELRALINAGHRRGAVAGRCVVRGRQIETEELPAYCALALAGLGNLPDTILTRAVVVRMRKRAPDEVVEPFRQRVAGPEGHRLRDELAEWVGSKIGSLSSAVPEMPEGVADRSADVWEPLLAIADAAGGDWPAVARAAAAHFVAESKTSTPSLGVLLLRDLRTVFGDREHMLTTELLDGLREVPESPWGDLKGKPLDARYLARLLRQYEVASQSVRVGSKAAKGYRREDLHDSWLRYLPEPDVTDVTDADEDGSRQEPQRWGDVTDVTDVTPLTEAEKGLTSSPSLSPSTLSPHVKVTRGTSDTRDASVEDEALARWEDLAGGDEA